MVVGIGYKHYRRRRFTFAFVGRAGGFRNSSFNRQTRRIDALNDYYLRERSFRFGQWVRHDLGILGY
jgi:hypothetical protein